MKIGTYLIKGPGTAEERLRIAKDTGFDFVCFGKSMFDPEGLNPEMCDRVGIGYDNIHLTGEKTTLIWKEGDAGEAIADRYCNEIRMATEYGVHTGIVHVTWGVTTLPEKPGEVGMARFYRIAECAEKHGFTIAIENSAFPEHIFAVLDGVKSPAFKHCYDSGHRNAFAPEYDFLDMYGDRLVATHIHDNDGKHDLHIMPFDGTIDWADLAKKLAKTTFAREKLCSEVGSAGYRKHLAGMSEEAIHADLSKMAMYGTKDLKISGDVVEVYTDLSYPEYVGRVYERMKRLADMVEAEAKKLS